MVTGKAEARRRREKEEKERIWWIDSREKKTSEGKRSKVLV